MVRLSGVVTRADMVGEVVLRAEVALVVRDAAAAAAALAFVVVAVVVVHALNGRSTKTTGKWLRAVCVGTVLPLCSVLLLVHSRYIVSAPVGVFTSVQKSQSAVFEISCR